MDEWVKIMHPDLPHTQENPPTVRRSSLESVWRDKGFTLWKPKKKAKQEGDS